MSKWLYFELQTLLAFLTIVSPASAVSSANTASGANTFNRDSVAPNEAACLHPSGGIALLRTLSGYSLVYPQVTPVS